MTIAPKVGIITFHDTPNYGATLQCYALSRYLASLGTEVEVINYSPPYTTLQYAKSLFLGRRRGLGNLTRVSLFLRFIAERLHLSGPSIRRREALRTLANRYDLAVTGSDEVWKVDHMRRFDPSFYLDFCDPGTTRIISYAASASMVTDLTQRAADVQPLLMRFSAIAVRDPETGGQVEALTGVTPELVVDPTLLWDWSLEDLPPMRPAGYVAVYSWLNDSEFAVLRRAADARGLAVVCVGCRHRLADENRLGVGPMEWLRLLKHADLVVTNFFHGVVFTLLFGRPLYAHVDGAKRRKLERILTLAGNPQPLHDGLDAIEVAGADWSYDTARVTAALTPLVTVSKTWLQSQIAAVRA